ncbi:MAG: Uma2 family endonuclease [Planctomycetes bacterium]|nr:Uma2 family endonuclease [Planctomycetota bacterium]
MAHVTESTPKTWTAADVVARFGAIPLDRIRHDPPPGSGTVDDVVRLDAHEDRLYELIDGVLLEKTVGAYESYLAVVMARLIGNFVEQARCGVVLGEGGMLQLLDDQVRIPDVAFISWGRLPNGRFPDDAVPGLVPDLAVEILSKNNTPQEMQGKLRDYFTAGVRLVWYVDPQPRQVRVYTSPDDVQTLTEDDTLDGGEVLPGLTIDLKSFFAWPEKSEA